MLLSSTIFEELIEIPLLKRYLQTNYLEEYQNIEDIQDLETLCSMILNKWETEGIDIKTNVPESSSLAIVTDHLSYPYIQEYIEQLTNGETFPFMTTEFDETLFKSWVYGAYQEDTAELLIGLLNETK